MPCSDSNVDHVGANLKLFTFWYFWQPEAWRNPGSLSGARHVISYRHCAGAWRFCWWPQAVFLRERNSGFWKDGEQFVCFLLQEWVTRTKLTFVLFVVGMFLRRMVCFDWVVKLSSVVTRDKHSLIANLAFDYLRSFRL
jgi:hypothetical protein